MTHVTSATDGGFGDTAGHDNAARAAATCTDLIGILDTVDLPIVVLKRDFTVGRFNRPAASALSLTASHIGQSPCGISVFADVMDLEKLCAQVIADGAPYRREVRHGERWFVLRIAPYTGGENRIEGTVLTLTNVTTVRASVEQAIYEREYTKAILNTVIGPLVVLDADLCVQTANRAFYTTFRVSREEAHGVPLAALPNHAWEAPRLWPLLKESVVGNKEFPTLEVEHNFPAIGRRTLLVDARLLTPNGGPRNLILVAFQDISERKQAESELRKSETRFRQLLSLLPTAVYSCDSSGLITFYNEQAARLWGRSPAVGDAGERFCGSHQMILPDGTVLPHEQCPMAIAAREGTAFRDQEVSIRRPDGSVINVRVNIDTIRDDSGRVIGAINAFHDITADKRAEEQLLASKREAEDASRAKDKFLAMLSHELRTPLMPVLMTTAALELRDDLAPGLREDLTMIRRNVELQSKLIDDLLDLSRIKSGKLRLSFDALGINDLVRHACETCRENLRQKAIRLECDMDEAAFDVVGDSGRLQQVFWNLLNNAAKFTPEGGQIYVRTENMGGREPGNELVRVTVRDTGRGIDPEKLRTIFGAFEQGEADITREFGGLGLGLTICHALVEQHRGSIAAYSEGKGKGCTVVVELPASMRRPNHDADGQSPMASQRQKLRSLHMLVVEDHPDTARILCMLLTRSGHTVRAANTAAGALKLAGEHPFDIIVSDLGLPDMTGYELVRQIKKINAAKAIAMSGFGMEEDIRKSESAGFSEHLVKPVTIEKLEQCIRRVLSRGDADTHLIPTGGSVQPGQGNGA